MANGRPTSRIVRRIPPAGGSFRGPTLPGAGFAVDLDRTLVRPGRRPPRVASLALREARAMGLKVILVSGRRHEALAAFADDLGAIDGIVGENGAVIEVPRGNRPVVVGRRVARKVHQRLRASRGLSVEFGEVVASVRRPDRRRAEALVRGLPVLISENVDRVMIVPEGIDKATGVKLALERFGLGGRGFAAIGDGENDVPMLERAVLAGTVANATSAARAVADYRCHAPMARGVAEFVRGPLAAWRREGATPQTRARPGSARSGC